MAELHIALENLDLNADSASPSASVATLNSHVPNPGFSPVNNNGGDIPEGYRQRLVTLLQRATQGGLQNSPELIGAVTPHLPAILALAKAGRLDSTQMAQLKTLVRAITENRLRTAQQLGQQPGNTLAAQPQPGQPLGQLPEHVRVNILQRARILAAQQGWHDEQHVAAIATAIFIRLQADRAAQVQGGMTGEAQP
ncbi:hypothetical protein FS749_003447 [Ceratobasidium sp. UAMH 11750]|nr:hypothetical protein FS749_003447 [Ceratobasidium sp. UAMH 11750]